MHDPLRVEALQGFDQLDEDDSDCPLRELLPPVGSFDERVQVAMGVIREH